MDKNLVILIAEDDEDDRLLIQEAFTEHNVSNPIQFVENGAELVDYLVRCSDNPTTTKNPAIIILDINMPKMNGIEALERVKTHPELRPIPVVMLTTSASPEHVSKSYQLGANSFLKKPNSYQRMMKLVELINICWLEIPYRRAS
jgi:two-component system response regulator